MHLKRTSYVGAVALTLASLCIGSLSSADAQGTATQERVSNTRCARGSGIQGGECWTRSTIYRHLKVLEAVPLENYSSKTGSFHCSFSRSISRSLEAGVSLTYEAKVNILDLVDAGTSTTLHMSVSQTATQATEAGATFTLQPHQRVTCERTYGYVTSRIKDEKWWGGTGSYAGSSTRYFTATIPARLGIRVVD